MRLEVNIRNINSVAVDITYDASTWSEQINYVNNAALFNPNIPIFTDVFQISGVNTLSILNDKKLILPDGGYPGFMSRKLSSDIDGTFIDADAPKISIKSSSIKQNGLWITFSEGYPVKYRITKDNQSTTIDNNTQRTIYIDQSFGEGDESVDVYITVLQWSEKLASVKISKISNIFDVTYDLNDLISITYSENLFNSQLQIQPGICEQYADIQLYDRDGILHELADKRALNEDYSVTITVVDDDTNKRSIDGVYLVNDWEVYGTSNTVIINCNDLSRIFDKINIEITAVKTRTVDDMLNECFNLCKVSWRYIDDDTQTYCENIKTPNCWFYKSTALQTLNKICRLGMLRVYWYIDSFIVARCY